MKGQTWLEYTMILFAVAVIAIGAYTGLGTHVASIASGVDRAITSA